MTARPFLIAIPDSALTDLKERLSRTRFPDTVAGSAWSYGANLSYMRELCAYWRDRFDWRAQESRLNALPQYLLSIEGHDIHFVHARGKGPSPLPVVVTHGWPSSFAEFQKLIPLLTDPAAHGGHAEDAFDVIAPSLPGYGFSSRPTNSGATSPATARLWLRLMEELGYGSFVAHGGDIGANVTNWLGRIGETRVRAIHAMAAPYTPDIEHGPPLSEAERSYMKCLADWEREEGGYEHEQRTRPQTLSFGLNDSPAGLAAWIVEKWRAWSDCGGDIETRFNKDELLTNISIYWLGESIGSSMRMYYDGVHPAAPRPPMIETPARLFLTTEKANLCPPEWAKRSYADLSYGLAPRGGHFMAAEEPELLAADLRSWFSRFR